MKDEKEKLDKLKTLLPSYVFQELINLPENGLAEIRLVNPKRSGAINIRDYTDAQGNRRLFLNEHGVERTFQYNKKITLNFSKLRDKLEYLHVKDHPFTTTGSMGVPILNVINLNLQAELNIAKKDLEAKVNGMISSLSGQELISFARILFIPIRPGSNESMIKEMVYDKASNDPEDVLSELESPDRKVKEVFFAAKGAGLIYDRMGTWYFQTEKIGVNMDQGIAWLKENVDLMPRIMNSIATGKKIESEAKPNADAISPLKVADLSPEEKEQYEEFVSMGDTSYNMEDYKGAVEAYDIALTIIKNPTVVKKRSQAMEKLKAVEVKA